MAKLESIKKLSSDSTMTVELAISKEFRIRLAIATKLIELSAWVLGCGSEVLRVDPD